ncbi:MAG: sigma factor-like helix-turn-helix DNA-binding protein [Peptostreptococcaceae bacterium]
MNYISETVTVIKNYNNIKIAQENLKDKLRDINTKLEGYKGISYGDIHGSGAGTNDKILNLMFEQNKTLEAYRENDKSLKKLNKLLLGLSQDEKEVILNAYIQDKTDTEIASSMNISRKTLNDKKRKAIKKLAVQYWGIKAI